MNEIVSYRIKSFTGFAPCFDNDLFTLATCKPELRATLGRRFEEAREEGRDLTEWVLGVVGKEMVKSDKYWQNEPYADRAEDILFVAKITDVARYPDYYSETDKYDRQDRIYVPDDNGPYKAKWSDQHFSHIPEEISGAHCTSGESQTDWAMNGQLNESAYVLKSTEYAIVSKEQSEQIVSLISETPGGKLVGIVEHGTPRGHTAPFACPDDAPLAVLLQKIVSSAKDHGFSLLPKDVRDNNHEGKAQCGCSKKKRGRTDSKDDSAGGCNGHVSCGSAEHC